MKGPIFTGNVSTTSSAQVRAFLWNVADNTKLRGKFNEETGDFVLYTSKNNRFADVMKGRNRGRREGARDVLLGLIKSMKEQQAGKTQTKASQGANDSLALLENILSHSRGSSLRSSQARLLLQAAGGAQAGMRAKASQTPTTPVRDLGDLSATFRDVGAQLLDGNLEQARTMLADALSQAARQNLTQEQREAFIFGDGDAEAADLSEAWGEGLEAQLPDLAQRTAFLKEALALAASQAGDDQTLDPDMRRIRIGGQDYTQGPQIGEGAFAKVYLYQSGNKQIAVKINWDPSPGANIVGACGREYRMLKAAYGEGHANIVKPEGAFRTADNKVVVAMECASNGDLQGMMTKLKEAVDQGWISSGAASAMRLTLLKNLAEGTKWMADNGVLHGDYKLPNVLIGSDGMPKVTDFGTAQQADDYRLADSSAVDNPSWLAPEVLFAREQSDAFKDVTPEAIPQAASVKEWLASAFAQQGLRPTTLTNVVKSIFSKEVEDGRYQITAGNRLDTWAFGMCALNLLTGEQIALDATRLSEIEGVVKGYVLGGHQVAIGEGGYFAPGSRGLGAEEELINQCLRPVPEERPTMAQILAHPAFRYPGVGSQAAIDLIKAMTDRNLDDNDRIQRLQQLSASLAPQ